MTRVSTGTVVGGKYRLDAPIGQGGMGSIWRATHTVLDTPVAVKVLETYGASRGDMAKRFLREAKLAGSIRHRNVVQILDFGVMDDEQPFMVMELLEGQSLADRLDDGPKPSEVELLDIVAQLLSGLAAVHDAGIVHRDIKPDNVFLVRDADGEYAKLLDFGISRGATGEAGDTRMTRTGAVVGTPLYMSPEQARGLRDVDLRTDLWSVGTILFEGLTATLPFEAEHVGDILIRVATEDAPSLASLRPELPDELVELVDRALQRDREARPESARAMRQAVLQAIEALRTGKPSTPRTAARARAALAPSSRGGARWPRWLGGAAVLALGAVATAVLVTQGAPGAAGTGSSTVEERVDTSTGEEERADPRPNRTRAASSSAASSPSESAPSEPSEIAAPPSPEPTREAATDDEPDAGSATSPRDSRRGPRRSEGRRPRSEGPSTAPPAPAGGARRPGTFVRDLDY